VDYADAFPRMRSRVRGRELRPRARLHAHAGWPGFSEVTTFGIRTGARSYAIVGLG